MPRSNAAKKRRQRERQKLRKQHQELRQAAIKTAVATAEVEKKLDAVDHGIDFGMGDPDKVPYKEPNFIEKLNKEQELHHKRLAEEQARKAKEHEAARARARAGKATDEDRFFYQDIHDNTYRDTEAEKDLPERQFESPYDAKKPPKPGKPGKVPRNIEKAPGGIPPGSDPLDFIQKRMMAQGHSNDNEDDADEKFKKEFGIRDPVREGSNFQAIRQAILALERQTDLLTKNVAGRAFSEAERQISQIASPGGAEDAIRQITYLQQRAMTATVGELKGVGRLVTAYQKVLAAQQHLSEDQRTFLTASIQQVKKGVQLRTGKESGAVNRVGAAIKGIFFDILGIEDWAGLWLAFQRKSPLLGLATSIIGHGVRAFRSGKKEQHLERMKTRLGTLQEVEKTPFATSQDIAAEPLESSAEQQAETKAETIQREKNEHEDTMGILKKIDTDEEANTKVNREGEGGLKGLIANLLELGGLEGIATKLTGLLAIPSVLTALSLVGGVLIGGITIAALAAAGYEIYTHWKDLKAAAEHPVDTTKSIVHDVGAHIAATLNGVTIDQQGVIDAKDELNHTLSNPSNAGKAKVEAMVAQRRTNAKMLAAGKGVPVPEPVGTTSLHDSGGLSFPVGSSGLPNAGGISLAIPGLDVSPQTVVGRGMTNGGNLTDAVTQQESGNDPGSVGQDTNGSQSFGLYQFNDKNGVLSDFVAYTKEAAPDIYQQLVRTGYNPETGGAVPASFAKTWKAIAKKDPARFAQLQTAFEVNRPKGIWQPLVEGVKKRTGIDLNTQPLAVQQAALRTANQFGPYGNKYGTGGLDIVSQALMTGNPEDAVLSMGHLRSESSPSTAKRFSDETNNYLKQLDTDNTQTRRGIIGQALMRETKQGQKNTATPPIIISPSTQSSSVVNANQTINMPLSPHSDDTGLMRYQASLQAPGFGAGY